MNITWTPDQPDGRRRAHADEALVAREKASLDVFWVKDDALADSENLLGSWA